MHWVINSFHGDTEWIKEYTDSVTFYDKKDRNVGSNIDDYLRYIVEHYDNLPDVILFGKSNMLQRHITKVEFDKLCNNNTFTPLLTQNHKTDGNINFYKDGLYYEKNDSWYFNHYKKKHFSSYKEFAEAFEIENPSYLGFAPGGCYIVPMGNILKHSRSFYERLRAIVQHDANPAEAHAIERALYTIWS